MGVQAQQALSSPTSFVDQVIFADTPVDHAYAFVEERTYDDLAFHYYQNTYKGIPIIGHDTIVKTSTDGTIQTAWVDRMPDVNLDVVADLDEKIFKQTIYTAL